MVCDTAIASLLSGNAGKRNIHAFILGADRIAANGDTANKISSYQIALLARHVPPPHGKHRTQTLICAPVATFDLDMETGSHIVIEERPSWEACTVRGKVYHHSPNAKAATSEATVASSQQVAGHAHVKVDGHQEKVDVVTVLITPEGTQAWNPAFDVVPAELTDGIACELGVVEKGGNSVFDLRRYVKQSGPPKPPAKEWREAEKAGGANGVHEQ